jgi:hypothetical protein
MPRTITITTERIRRVIVRSSSEFLGVPRSPTEGPPENHSEEPEELRGTPRNPTPVNTSTPESRYIDEAPPPGDP